MVESSVEVRDVRERYKADEPIGINILGRFAKAFIQRMAPGLVVQWLA